MPRTSSPLAKALLLAVVLALSAGCSDKITRQSKLSDAEIFGRANRHYADRSFGPAAEHYQVMLEKYPTSPLAAQAQLRLADARMEKGDAVEAEAAFDDFLRLFPSDDNVAYALFRKGEMLARDATEPGRDQARTVEAIRAFDALLRKEPAGPRAVQARERIASLRGRLAEHELLVVRHYMKRKMFDSAALRAARAAADFPDTPAARLLMTLQAEALDRAGKPSEAAGVRAALAARFPPPTGGKK